MMWVVGDNQPGQPVPPEPPLPPGWTAEQVRQFQEFQQFQDFLRFTQAQAAAQQAAAPPTAGNPDAPTPPSGAHLVPYQSPQQVPPVPVANLPAQPPAAEELSRALVDMREQLTRIERVTNPPWWRKLLRSRLAFWAGFLVVLLIFGLWGVPAIVHHYFGGGTATPGGPQGALPAQKSQSGELPKSPKDTVAGLYYNIAQNESDPTGGFAPVACFRFNASAGAAFARQFGANTCQAAIATLSSQVTDATDYAQPDLSELPEPANGVTTDTIDSCSFTVTGGPNLGVFTLTQQVDGGWEITGYTAPPATCPPPSTSITPTG